MSFAGYITSMPHDVIGLHQGEVVLHPHSEHWRQMFNEERERLKSLLGDHVLDIFHIGSTSAPGISAKPIIDILVSLHRFSDTAILYNVLEQAGYEYRENGSNEMRILFVKGTPAKRTHHIHLTEHQSPEWEKAFLFWDYLHAHPKALTEYNELKQSLAQQYPEERDKYSAGKASFIQNIIKKARSEN